MSKPVSSDLTEDRLCAYLTQGGFLTKPRTRRNGLTGSDAVASKDGLTYFFEVIGYKKNGSARSRDFYEAVFRALSRIKGNADKVAVVCPIDFTSGLSERTAVYDRAWLRLGDAFPELELWFVLPDGRVDRGSWNYWFRAKNRKYLTALGKIVE